MRHKFLLLLTTAIFCGCSNGNQDTGHNDGHDEEGAVYNHEHDDDVFEFDMDEGSYFTLDSCRRMEFGQVIKTTAEVLPSQTGERTVTAPADGEVVFSGQGLAEGTSVGVGQVLFSINSSKFLDKNVEVEYMEAETAYKLAKQEYERKLSLAEDKIVSRSDLNNASAEYEKAEARYNSLKKNFPSGKSVVSSPVGGYISRISVSNGEYVSQGTPIITIANNTEVQLRAEVSPRYNQMLRGDISANIRPSGSNDIYSLESLSGHLMSVGKSVAQGSPLLPVIFQVNNSVGMLPGTFVDIYIKSPDCGREGAPHVSVPSTSLIEEMGNYFVYVCTEAHHYRKQEVEIGANDGQYTEILSGLSGSETIVSRGAILIKLAQSAGTVDVHSGHAH